MGCPRATAPPFTLTFAGSRPRIWREEKDATEGRQVARDLYTYNPANNNNKNNVWNLGVES